VTKRKSVRIPAEARDALAALAKARGRSMSATAADLIDKEWHRRGFAEASSDDAAPTQSNPDAENAFRTAPSSVECSPADGLEDGPSVE
jgi:hypothetical protein